MLNSVQTMTKIQSQKKHSLQNATDDGELKISPELRYLVRESVALLGEVIRRELGDSDFQQIESIRQCMTSLREASEDESLKKLHALKKEMGKASREQRYQVAHAFTLMIELMNVAENAYRTHRLKVNRQILTNELNPDSITYVLTAHPTEARAPQNIAIYHEIQKILVCVLETQELEKKLHLSSAQRNELLHGLELAWRTPVMRERKPKVKDEAAALYAQLFRPHILNTLMKANEHKIRFQLHSWIGGDKDGHPGVDEKTLLQSLTLSRVEILKMIQSQLLITRNTLKLVQETSLIKKINQLLLQMKKTRVLKANDAGRILSLRTGLLQLAMDYEEKIGGLHPELLQMKNLLELFPGLVIPMELRESSDVIMARPEPRKSFAIDRMLQTLSRLAHGQDPRWYAHSFIISMCQSVEHMRTAAQKQKKFLGGIFLPIVPLFEEASSLAASPQIIAQVFQDDLLKKAIHQRWNSRMEIMVGYSDSSKEAGVLPSRLAIAKALPELENVCEQHQIKPIFFHGSGGSIDRGGGPVDNQTAWWPKAGVRNYKVTVQGEMIERWLATPMIAERQLEKIAQSARDVLKKKSTRLPKIPALEQFADKVTQSYRAKITDPEFLQIVKVATPYPMMSTLKIGSRPARRTKELTVQGLRAIPWIMCWTQTRLLFPIWWGVGQAWDSMSDAQKKDLRTAFLENPAFNSYMKALDFTLAKVELAVFKTYLEVSRLPSSVTEKFSNELEAEFQGAFRFCKSIVEEKNLLEMKPWLKESVLLRAPMIHPLNILQMIAMEKKEIDLLRLTVTGISSGMMATG